MESIGRIMAEFIYIVVGAWCISDAVLHFKSERYFLFGFEVMLAIGIAVVMSCVLASRVFGI